MMTYFTAGKTETGYGPMGIILQDHIFSLCKTEKGVLIREECDGYFAKEYTIEEVIALFEEAIGWVKTSNPQFLNPKTISEDK